MTEQDKIIQDLRREVDGLTKALEMACDEVDSFGFCPRLDKNWECERCSNCDRTLDKCWNRYFLEKAGEE